MKRLMCLLALACVMATAAPKKKKPRPSSEPGRFDYYVYTLSWSPQYCSNHSDPGQCQGTRPFAFVVHGLWPQYEVRWPESCQPPSPVPQDTLDKMLDLMPNPQLIQHEWDKHGTCSGLGQQGYFDAISALWIRFQVPEDYRQPLKQVTQSPSQIRDHFMAANQDLDKDSFRVGCSGRYMSQVQICLTKDFKTRACGSDVKDTCKASTVIFRPVR